jgi:hypothetical protein
VLSVGDFQKFSEARIEKIQPKQLNRDSLWTNRKMETNLFPVSNLFRLEVNEDWTDVILCGYLHICLKIVRRSVVPYICKNTLYTVQY